MPAIGGGATWLSPLKRLLHRRTAPGQMRRRPQGSATRAPIVTGNRNIVAPVGRIARRIGGTENTYRGRRGGGGKMHHTAVGTDISPRRFDERRELARIARVVSRIATPQSRLAIGGYQLDDACVAGPREKFVGEVAPPVGRQALGTGRIGEDRRDWQAALIRVA